jgi:hypothetical protein
LSFAPDGGGLLRISGTSFADFNPVDVDGKVDLTGASIQFSFDTAAALPCGALALGAEPLLLASTSAAATPVLDADFTFHLASLFNFIGEDAGFAAEN